MLDWEAAVHTGASTRDGVELGNVIQVDDEKVVTIQGAVHEKELVLPHAVITEFNGAGIG